jgi:hypothetical protein
MFLFNRSTPERARKVPADGGKRDPAVGAAEVVRGDDRRRRDRPGGPGRGVLLDARSLRLRQDDGPAPDRRLRDPHRGPRRARRAGGHRPRALRAGRPHRLPGLRPLPAHERRAERRLRPQGPRGAQGGAAGAGPQGARRGTPGGLRQTPAGPALGRAAPACRPRPGAGRPSPGAAAGRTAGRAGPEAAGADAGRTQGAPAGRRDHLRPRHPRPAGGPDDERPHRRPPPGPRRTGRHPGRDLRTARDALRGVLRRHVQPPRWGHRPRRSGC